MSFVLFLFTQSCSADMILPFLLSPPINFQMHSIMIAFVVICIMETLIIRFILKPRFILALQSSLIANLASALLGFIFYIFGLFFYIYLTFFFSIIAEMFVLRFYYRQEKNSRIIKTSILMNSFSYLYFFAFNIGILSYFDRFFR